MAISRAKEQFERDKVSKFQRMLELEKQRALERLNADPTSSSPHTNQSPNTLATHTTSPASPVSLSSDSNPPPSYLRSHPTVSRRPLPVDSPLATPKNDFHPGKARQGGSQEVEAAEAAEAVAANNSTCDAASTTTALSHQTRYAHQLPPIRTDIGAASLAAEITEAFPTYQEDGSMDAAGRRRQSRPSSRLVPPQPSPQPSPEPSPAGQPDSGVELDSSVGPSPVGGDEARGRRRRLTKPLPTAVAQNRSTQSADRSEPAPASPTTKPGKYYPPQSYTGSKKAHAESESRTRQHQQHPPSAGGKAGGTAPGESVDAAAADSSRRGRSRSRSISSLFRRSLDGRRSSFGLGSSSQDTGFIGGIKLEKERLEAHERSLSERPIGPEADIHPALRTNDNQKTRRRSPSPFKFSTTQRNSEPRDSHYPPIAIRNQSQSQVFVNAERPRSSSGSSISRWKARAQEEPHPDKSPPFNCHQHLCSSYRYPAVFLCQQYSWRHLETSICTGHQLVPCTD
ncbi:Conserved serine-rich protein [Geosmithia morbida]|uniref:Conserved serine-rich protein n=1 Tax=Geosmithia morbida TaxID=1094350 RepID=A0A9P4Z066_9HYPO|nr:Conserved serine-rich protein [Geosmithia morbida]KAF4124858.1 Conserved serine-rich protein [Geosmithia morbida]